MEFVGFMIAYWSEGGFENEIGFKLMEELRGICGRQSKHMELVGKMIESSVKLGDKLDSLWSSIMSDDI
jgi:hypothetical protein